MATFHMGDDGQYHHKKNVKSDFTFSEIVKTGENRIAFTITETMPGGETGVFYIESVSGQIVKASAEAKAALDSLKRVAYKIGTREFTATGEELFTAETFRERFPHLFTAPTREEFERRLLSLLGDVGRKTIIGEIIYRIVRNLAGLEAKALKRIAKQLATRKLRKAAKVVTTSAAKQTTIGLGQIVSGIQPRLDLDFSRFNNALREYMRYTRKDLVDVVNQKAYWASIGALKKTYKADRSAIDTGLDAGSSTIPGVSVGQAMAISRLRGKGIRSPKKSEINVEVRKIKNARKRAIGFLKSGWIPAIKILSIFAPSKSGGTGVSTSGIGVPKGGAAPAVRRPNDIIEASFWNSIVADNNPKAHSYMVTALNESMNEQAADMESYIKRKMERNAQRFNRA